jgi:dihydroorotate dehydrogenase electron transfer subunit
VTLVGGGYGSAPLLPLAVALRERGCRVDVVLGAGSSDRLFGFLEAKRMADSISVSTDDGSMGVRGG